jgi:hypothetical protein
MSTAAAAVAFVYVYIAGQWDISGLYGAVPLDIEPIDGVKPDLYNKMLQVCLLRDAIIVRTCSVHARTAEIIKSARACAVPAASSMHQRLHLKPATAAVHLVHPAQLLCPLPTALHAPAWDV